jgi:hypothetical protein
MITGEERAANTTYHQNRRLSLNPDQQEAAKLSHTKSSIKNRLRKDAENYVRTQQGWGIEGFGVEQWDNAE